MSTGEIIDDLTEDDVAGGDVEAVDRMEELVAIERVGQSLEVLEVVGEVGESLEAHGSE